MDKKDAIFNKKLQKIIDFNFGKSTAEVFTDMLRRSVPQYSEILRMMGEISSSFAVDNTNCGVFKAGDIPETGRLGECAYSL